MKRRDKTFIIFALILAAIVGGLIGHIVGSFLPAESAAKTLFSNEFSVGFDETTLDLWVITVTFGIWIKINFVSVLTMILVLVYFKWWYF